MTMDESYPMSHSQKKAMRAIGIFLFTLVALQAYAAEPRAVNPEDPYERLNRVFYDFNELVDKVVMRPIARIYNLLIPKPITKGVSHIFTNIDNIPTIANDLLQMNFYQATSDAWRLLINTTIGIAGFFDVAAQIGLENNHEDLGLTFAQWGWKNSTYLVIPFLGPSTLRDGVAWPINYELLTVYPYISPTGVRYAAYSTNLISKRADILRYQDVMEQAALDKYVFMRNAYMQNRSYQIERNKQLGDPYLEKNNLGKLE